MSFYYSVLLFIAVVIAMVIIDSNVGKLILLIPKIIMLSVERFFWMIRLHPKNPITNLIEDYKINRNLKEFDRNME